MGTVCVPLFDLNIGITFAPQNGTCENMQKGVHYKSYRAGVLLSGGITWQEMNMEISPVIL